MKVIYFCQQLTFFKSNASLNVSNLLVTSTYIAIVEKNIFSFYNYNVSRTVLSLYCAKIPFYLDTIRIVFSGSLAVFLVNFLILARALC